MPSRKVAIYPQAGDPDEIRVWIGVRGEEKPSTTVFHFDGQADSSFERLRDYQELSDIPGRAEGERAWTALYARRGVSRAEGGHSLVVNVGGHPSNRLRGINPRPDEIPASGLRVLLGSCYYYKNDQGALKRSLDRRLPPSARPDLSFFVGDQVYLDAPWHKNSLLSTAQGELEASWREKYFETFFSDDGLLPACAMAPAVCVPDDHEFWNNYPMTTAVTRWRPSGDKERAEWFGSANALFKGVQEPAEGYPRRLDVDPISFLALDVRTHRDAAFDAFLTGTAMSALDAWLAELSESGRFGVLVASQPILRDPQGWLKRSEVHARLGDYDQFGDLGRKVHSALARGDILWLGGDVHWGRAARARTHVHSRERARLWEVISSPLSLVDGGRSVFWGSPSHSDPEKLAEERGEDPRQEIDLGDHRYGWEAAAGAAGDQWCVLDFNKKSDDEVEVSVWFVPVEGDREPSRDRARFTMTRR